MSEKAFLVWIYLITVALISVCVAADCERHVADKCPERAKMWIVQ